MLGVGDGLVERLAEVERDQHGQVGVGALALLVRVAVHHGEAAVVVLLAHEAAGVLAERAHLVAKRRRVAHKLGLVQDVVDVLHHLVADLHANAQVNGAGRVADPVLRAHLVKPERAAPAGGYHGLGGQDPRLGLGPAGGRHDGAQALLALHQHLEALVLKQDPHARVQQLALHARVDLLRLFSPQVADGAVDQLEAGLDGAAADVRDALGMPDALHVRVRAQPQVDVVHAQDAVRHDVRPHELRKVAAHLGRERELPVAERAGSREARGDPAGGASRAVAGRLSRATAPLDGQALLHHGDGPTVAPSQQAKRREDSGGACAHDEDVRAYG